MNACAILELGELDLAIQRERTLSESEGARGGSWEKECEVIVMPKATVASTSTAVASTTVGANGHIRRRVVGATHPAKSVGKSDAHVEYLARMNAFLDATDDDQPAPAVSLEQIVKAARPTHSKQGIKGNSK